MENNESYTIACELVKRLRVLFDDREFFLAILSYADTDSDRQAIIDFIDAGDDVDVETVTVMALDLNDLKNNR